MSLSHAAIWCISFTSILLMLIRPRNIPEVWWISAGAGALVALRLIPLHMAVQAVAKGNDVYLFLIGMMLLAELAQVHGIFDWLATIAIERAKGSRKRLFALIYATGALVTILMSNDATAVVLTPAILAAVKKTKADPLPYLFICAFIANAASFVLPISNPANLVVFHGDVPPLGQWLEMFLAGSIVSIAVTYFVLRWYCREALEGEMENDVEPVKLSGAGKLTLGGLAVVAAVLLVFSALGKNLGLPTCVASVCIAIGLSIRERMNPSKLVKGISWSVLPLVAGLFVLVEAVSNTGALQLCQDAVQALQQWEPLRATMLASFAVGVGTNLINNLPLGLIAGASVNAAHVTGPLRSAILIGVDLGPNLSITGSLATILWLIAIRKEGLHVSAWTFLKAGLFVMFPALLLATLAATLCTWW
jgi:arsenical pump membrane protein